MPTTLSLVPFILTSRTWGKLWSRLQRARRDDGNEPTDPANATDVIASVLDSLSGHIAVLDRRGNIVTVNAAWKNFAHDNGAPHWANPIGHNYLHELENAEQRSDGSDATAASVGIQAVMAGKQARFILEYPCHGPKQQRWFRMEVTPRVGPDSGVVIIHIDITESTLEELRTQRERKLRDLVWDQTSDGLCIVDPEDNVLDCNAAVEKRTGLGRRQLIGRPVMEVFTTDVPINLEATRREVADTGRARLLRRMHYPDGSARTMDTRVFPVRDDAGAVVARIALSRDVTEKILRQELEQRYGAIWSQSPDGIAVTDVNGVILSVNPALQRLLECTEADAAGRSILDFFEGLEAQGDNPFTWEDLSDRPVTKHHRLRTALGKELEVEISLSQMRLPTEDGSEKRTILVMIQDVTALTAAARDLMAARDLLNRTEAAALIGGLDIDYTTNYITRTDGIYRIYEIDVGDKAAADAFRDRWGDMPEMAATMKIAARSVTPWKTEVPLRTAKGRDIWLSVSGTPRVRDGKVVGVTCLLRDITERRAAAEEMKRTLALLRRTEQISGTGGWSENLLTGEAFATPEIYRIADVEPEAPDGMKEIYRIFRPETVSPPGHESRALALAGHSWDREFEIVSAKGRRKWVRGRGVPVLRDGVVIALEGHMQDITARREAEQEVERLNRLLHTTQVIAKIGGWKVDVTSGAVTWTAGLYTIYDMEPGDTAALEEYRRRMSLDPDLVLTAAIEAATRNGTPYELERPGVTAKGRKIWVHIRGEALVVDGKITALTGFVQDITVRKEAELKLVQAGTQLQTTLDATIDGMTSIDARGIILSTNRAMTKIFGYAPEEMLGQNVSVLMPQPDQAQHDGYLANHQRTGIKKIIGIGREVVGRRKDGTEFPLDLAVAELHGLDGNARYLGTIRDITARKIAEDQLRAAQKMEAVGQLTAGVAHDFNNLLAVIAANLELLAEDLEGNTKLSKRIESALKASDRGADLTQHLLAFGRNQALSPKLHNLCTKVQDSSRLLKRTLPGNIAIEVMTNNVAPVQALVDEAQLENALLNLGLNARDAMKSGGVLLFSVGVRVVKSESADTLDGLAPGRYAQITVQDTGTGMSQATLDRAFDPFFTTKPVGQGSGLGLSMVYGFVHQSGGYVRVTSKVGEGTAFNLLFPLCEDALEENAREGSEPSRKAEVPKLRVLLVEDIDDVRTAIKDQLETLGLQVITAADGAQALAMIGAEPIDLLLTDLGLPGNIDGDELADIAAECVPGLKIITMTGYNKDRVTGNAVQGGPHRAHLRKPFKRAEFTKALNDLFA